MPANPLPGDAVLSRGQVQGLPEILVFDLFLPSAGLPAVDPTGNAGAQILGIGEELHLARLLQLQERLDGSLQLHSIVGGRERRAAKFLLPPGVLEDGRPSAGAGIPEASTIGMDRNLLHASAASIARLDRGVQSDYARLFEAGKTSPARHSPQTGFLFRAGLPSMIGSVTLKALIHNAEEGGFWAEVPALPGCVTQGETLDELRANIREAIEGWLAVEEPAQSDADQVIEVAV